MEDPLDIIRNLAPIECGEGAAKHFAFDPGYINLNHGSYGSTPNEVMDVHRHFRMKAERRPDAFVRYEYRTHLLDEAPRAVEDYLKIPIDTLVMVQNATIAFDTILRNLSFQPGDVIVCFAPIYDAFYHTIQYLSETTPVELEKIEYTLPQSDEYICAAFEHTIKTLRLGGKRPAMAIFDTISSLPAARMPFERLTEICRANNILSCIDGAHGIGQFPLDMTRLDPDFFTSNCHKWLHVPKPCGFLYVPLRNQHLLRATIPTGFNSFRSRIGQALLWRRKMTWNELTGEAAIMAYTQDLAAKGGQEVASVLGTEVLNNVEGTLAGSSMTNVRLPLALKDLGDTSAVEVAETMKKAMILDHEVAVNIFTYGDGLWVRLSAQIYLTLRDFLRAGEQLKLACETVKRGFSEAENGLNTSP